MAEAQKLELQTSKRFRDEDAEITPRTRCDLSPTKGGPLTAHVIDEIPVTGLGGQLSDRTEREGRTRQRL